MALPMRLIDLRCDWLRQYATETTLFDPALYADVARRLGRLDGYLQGTAAAVLYCARKREDWARQSDPWGSLAELLAVYEAEFAGRLLIAPADVARWRAEPPDGLCWGMLAVAGFDFLVRTQADLDRLPVLFDRGIRVFQLAETAANALAGSAEPGDRRGLTDLGRAFLGRLGELSDQRAPGPMPIVDLAGLNALAIAEILDWFESQAACGGRLSPIFSHGGVCHKGLETARALNREHLMRLRAMGGFVGLTPSLPCCQTPDDLKAAIEAIASVPFEGRPGFEGIGIGTEFLACDETLPGLDHVAHIHSWITCVFDQKIAGLLLHDNGRKLITRAAGVVLDAGPTG
jgi:membrane dipeptidase